METRLLAIAIYLICQPCAFCINDAGNEKDYSRDSPYRKDCGSFGAVLYKSLGHTNKVNPSDDTKYSPLLQNGGAATLHNSITDLNSSTQFCGAVLISEDYLLTAAHCVKEKDKKNIGISLGRGDLDKDFKPGNDTYFVDMVHIHDEYGKGKQQYHDLAILKTNRPVDFSAVIWPFCLPLYNQVHKDHTMMQIVGWGLVNQASKSSLIVREYIEIVSNSRCQQLWRDKASYQYKHDIKKTYPRGISCELLCAKSKGIDACEGDSGGPLSHEAKDGSNEVIGIIARGISNCPDNHVIPGLYTSVGYHLDWIYETTNISRPTFDFETPETCTTSKNQSANEYIPPVAKCGSYGQVVFSSPTNKINTNDDSALLENGGAAALHNSTKIFTSRTQICGASLVSDRYLLTAAHCVKDLTAGNLTISLGRDDLDEKNETNKNIYHIENITTHWNFTNAKHQYHDIAILRTNRRVLFTPKIWPFCLPEKNQKYDNREVVHILGWGFSKTGIKTSSVKHAHINIIKNSDCEKKWEEFATQQYKDLRKRSYPDGFTEEIICANRKGVDACEGDSGGPMSHIREDGLKEVIGLIAKGISYCPEDPIAPGIYTNVTTHIDWIYENTGLTPPKSKSPESASNACVKNPCTNGSTCQNLSNVYECLCPPGFTGQFCKMKIDECECVHGSCMDELNSHPRCDCDVGYTGGFCDIVQDDCSKLPCRNNGKCTEYHLNSNSNNEWNHNFTCECTPGFSGTFCQTEMKADFVLEFPRGVISDFAKYDGLFHLETEVCDATFPSLSCCFWMCSDDKERYGTPFSYATEVSDNVFSLLDYTGFTFYVNGNRRKTEVSANDGEWHHVCVTWTSIAGSWNIYLDGDLKDRGFDLSTDTNVNASGVLVLGQEQDQYKGGFSPIESFKGKITQFNIWDEVLVPSKVKELYIECDRYVGNVRGWPDMKLGVKGNIMETSSSFCSGCDSHFELENGYIDQNQIEVGSKRDVGVTVKVTCKKGYSLFSGEDVRKCLVHGEWSGEEPKCKPLRCGFEGNLENGKVEVNSSSYEGTAKYVCNPGFKLKGEEVRTCGREGIWIYDMPICEDCPKGTTGVDCSEDYNECKDDPCINGGACSNNIGSFKCQCPYGFTGQYCEEDLNYCATDNPCVEGICRNITGLYQCFCKPGFLGVNCDINRNSCAINPCINGGTCIDRVNSYQCECRSGYDGRNCQINRGISKNNDTVGPGRIDIMKCEAPPSVVNGSLNKITKRHNELGLRTATVKRTRGTSKCINCAWPHGPHYFLHHSDCTKFIQCTPYGPQEMDCADLTLFDPDLSICNHEQLTNCITGDYDTVDGYCNTQSNIPVVNPKVNFYGSVLEYEVGDRINWSCDYGYVLDGINTAVCSQGGIWSSNPPQCQRVSCRLPEKPDFGVMNGDDYKSGGTITYSCLTGYILKGEVTLTCEANGQWSSPPPRCNPVLCGPLIFSPPVTAQYDIPEHGVENAFGTFVRFNCEENYELIDDESETQCLRNGNWSVEIPQCHPVSTTIPPFRVCPTGYVGDNCQDDLIDNINLF